MNNESNFSQLLINSSNLSMNGRCLFLTLFEQSVHNVSAHQLQQHTIQIWCKLIQLPYQWTCEANNSVSSTKQSFSSARCWPALACVFIVFQHCSPHNNPLAYPHGLFAYIFSSESQFSYLFTWKNALLSLSGYNFYTIANIAMEFAVYVAWMPGFLG